MQYRTLPGTALEVSEVCLGTMTWGEQNDEAQAHEQLELALALGINFIDTAEMYPVPARADSFADTERLIGRWLSRRPGRREQLVIATKVSGPSRGYDWIRNGSTDLRAADIVAACEDSLKRLQTEYIDLYQIHWPNRHVPMFGGLYFEPAKDQPVTSIHEQLEALDRLVRSGMFATVLRSFGRRSPQPGDHVRATPRG